MLKTLPSPRSLGIPQFDRLRPEQELIVNAFLESDKKYLVVAAPPGVGKSLIAPYLQRLTEKDTLYVVHSLVLQNQVLEEFPYGREIKGRSHYATLNGDPLTSCKDCVACKETPECYLCAPNEDSCTYKVAKWAAINCPFVIANYAYFLNENRARGSFNRPLVVLDECDMLEEQLRGMGDIKISDKSCRELGFRPSSLEELRQFAYQANYYTEDERLTEEEQWTWRNLVERVGLLVEESLSSYIVDWSELRFIPIQVDRLAYKFIWRKLPLDGKVILMSGVIPSVEMFCNDLGIKEYDSLDIPSPFPVESRRIYYGAGVDMSSGKETPEGFAQMAQWVGALAQAPEYRNERILIHTSSIERSRALYNHPSLPESVRARLVVAEEGGLPEAVQEQQSKSNGMLASASALRGLNLKGDLCRLIIWFKAPWPYLGDPVVQARRARSDGRIWYKLKAVSSFVQGCGRGNRDMEDWCDVYILDKSCMGLLKNSPKWIQEAVVYDA